MIVDFHDHLTRMFPNLHGRNETVPNRLTPSENVSLVTWACCQRRNHSKSNDSKRECFVDNLCWRTSTAGTNRSKSNYSKRECSVDNLDSCRTSTTGTKPFQIKFSLVTWTRRLLKRGIWGRRSRAEKDKGPAHKIERRSDKALSRFLRPNTYITKAT
jgi:hypothetical protein